VLLPPSGILPAAKFTLLPSLPFWQHYCTAFEQWASAKVCSVVQEMELGNFCTEGATYIWQGGHHVGHLPTL